MCNLHTLDTARTYCDRVIRMRAWQIVFDGSAARLTTDSAHEIYGADEEFPEAATSESFARASRELRRSRRGRLRPPPGRRKVGSNQNWKERLDA